MICREARVKFNKLLISFFLLNSTANIFAWHPISDKGPFDYIYPKYPEINYSNSREDQLAKKGEYLSKAGDCIACHTNMAEKGKPFAGGLPIVSPFGTFYTPNITPDKKTGIGTWTEKDFIRAMKHGKMPSGANYFPALPYVFFSKVYEEDIKAIFAFLKKVPAVEMQNKEYSFPLNVPGARLGMYVWNFLFFKDTGDYKYDDTHTKGWNRGAYLVEGLGHCSMCHTPLNVLGSPKTKYYLTGGFVDGYWAPNITRWGLKGNSQYEVAEVFADGKLINKAGPVAGPMADVNHNSLGYLTKEDQEAIATYLKTIVSEEPFQPNLHEAQAPLKLGRQVYINACVHCHQEGVLGAPRITDEGNWVDRLKAAGKQSLYRNAINGYNQMPAKGACVTCSDQDIKKAVDYILHEALPRDKWQAFVDNKSFVLKPSDIDGKKIYQNNCAHCHNNGSVGAPKFGDKKVWNRITVKNFDKIIYEISSGKNNSHPVGGCKHCTTAEVIAATKYIMDNSTDEKNYELW